MARPRPHHLHPQLLGSEHQPQRRVLGRLHLAGI